jgi:hypothetical protein
MRSFNSSIANDKECEMNLGKVLHARLSVMHGMGSTNIR